MSTRENIRLIARAPSDIPHHIFANLNAGLWFQICCPNEMSKQDIGSFEGKKMGVVCVCVCGGGGGGVRRDRVRHKAN